MNQSDIAILLPCYNEALTIVDVVHGFRQALPSARIYVYDNNSTDDTALRAALAGATVVRENLQGKGHVVRRMFSDIDAEIYVMADGDGTYSPQDAPGLVAALKTEKLDMLVGTRRNVTQDAGRQGHAFGNRIFNLIYRRLFGPGFTDIFSGYRVFSRRFAKSFPAISSGFEIETEMSVHAQRIKLKVAELPLDYGRRPEGSHSKLSSFKDGFRILWMFAMLLKETRPFVFFSSISGIFFGFALMFLLPVLTEYAKTGLVHKLPSFVASVTFLMLAMMTFMAGVILDSVARGRNEHLRMHYMSIAQTTDLRERSVPVPIKLADKRRKHAEAGPHDQIARPSNSLKRSK